MATGRALEIINEIDLTPCISIIHSCTYFVAFCSYKIGSAATNNVLASFERELDTETID